MLNTRHNQRGVTLIELGIGLLIVAILLGIGAPAISSWVQNTRIRSATESILSGLQLARAEAVRLNTPVRFQLTDTDDNSCTIPGGSTPPNWVISQDDPTGLCGSAPSDTVAPRIIQKRSSAEGSTGGITVSASEVDAATSATAGTVFSVLIFNGLGRVVTASPSLASGDNAIMDVENPGGGACVTASPPGTMRCLRIVVSNGGQIRMCDPSLLRASNPQGC